MSKESKIEVSNMGNIDMEIESCVSNQYLNRHVSISIPSIPILVSSDIFSLALHTITQLMKLT